MNREHRHANGLTRRRLMQLAGTAGTLAVPSLTIARLDALAAQDAPSGELVIGVTADDYRVDPPERANVGYYPLNTNIFEALVRLTPGYQIEPMLAEL